MVEWFFLVGYFLLGIMSSACDTVHALSLECILPISNFIPIPTIEVSGA